VVESRRRRAVISGAHLGESELAQLFRLGRLDRLWPRSSGCLAANELWMLIESYRCNHPTVGSARDAQRQSELSYGSVTQGAAREGLGPKNPSAYVSPPISTILLQPETDRPLLYRTDLSSTARTLATTYIAAAVPSPTPSTKPQISRSALPAASSRESSTVREVRSVVIAVAGVSFVPRRCVHGYVLELLRRG
jgi:hypothetical protein